MTSLHSTIISEYRPADLHFHESLEKKAFYKQICHNNNHRPMSYHWFCKLFYNIESNTSINDHTLSILNRYTKLYHLNNKPYTVSIANKIPIVQFISDIYFQSVFKSNLTINQFMESSNFLSSIPSESRPYHIIRTHLTDYLKHIHQPINTEFINTMDHSKEEGIIKHNRNRILYYLTHIHHNVSALRHLRQIDIIYITQKISGINDQYFDDLGIEYQRLCTSNYADRSTTFWSMMRRFNDALHTKVPNKRCIVLIMSDSDSVNNDTVYIYEALEHNTLPEDIINYTEIPFIINSKNDCFLPNLSLNKHDALSLSIHRHKDIERVYIKYRSYGMRVFKYNLKDILTPFCSTEDHVAMQLKWEEEIKHREFKDAEYMVFIMTYFNDLGLIPNPQISYYFESQCFKRLYKYIIAESTDYMYSPTPYEHYIHINTLMNAYYKDMGCDLKEKHNLFIKYIDGNEFGDCSVDENIGLNANVNECVISCFDDTFPVICDNEDIEEYIFYFLQHCYLYGSLPTHQYMLKKDGII